MDLTPYVERLRRDLAAVAQGGGDEAVALAERLTAPLESAARLVLLEALSHAAADITRELAPGSVEVRLRGLDPEFSVALPPTEEAFPDAASNAHSVSTDDPVTIPGDTDATARVNLRLPESLKARVEGAAAAQSLSVNAWLVRAAAHALTADDGRRAPGRNRVSGGQRFTGWVN